MAGQQYDYGFDTIGNRTWTRTGGDPAGANEHQAAYTANNLNQYVNRQVPGVAEVMGVALANETVTVNSQATSRKAEYFWTELGVNNGSQPVWTNATVSATGEQNITRYAYVPKTPEPFAYDLDGNLTGDGHWTYTWDAENRLVSMTNINSSVGPQQGLKFEYDWQGRRIHKQVWSQGPNPTNDVLFVYDGWNPIAQLNATNDNVIQGYVWGLDLSGSQQGAGGVGGLLEVSDPVNGVHFAAYDGNGNVSAAWRRPRDGSVQPFTSTAPSGKSSAPPAPWPRPIRSGSRPKYQDDETDLVYYGSKYVQLYAS